MKLIRQSVFKRGYGDYMEFIYLNIEQVVYLVEIHGKPDPHCYHEDIIAISLSNGEEFLAYPRDSQRLISLLGKEKAPENKLSEVIQP